MVDSISIIGPGWRATNSSGQIITDGVLEFFDAGTSNARTVYSDSSLSTSLGTTVDCNSGGYPVTSGNVRTLIYTGNTAYKVLLTSDAVGGTVWEHDNVLGALDTSGFLTEAEVADQSVVNISANRNITSADKGKLINMNCSGGTLAATLADASTLGDGFFVGIRHDGTANAITITGDGSDTFGIAGENVTSFSLIGRGHSIWIACDGVNFKTHSEMLPIEAKIRPQPQGYLTLVSGTPVITADQVSATTVYYTPDKGNLISIGYDVKTFSELSLALASQHVANMIYDLFVFSDSGTLRLGTGPAWSDSGAGTGARSSALARVNGILVNDAQITARNGANTYTVAANQGTYVGSIFMDGTNGQVTCHRSFGQSRKWGLWNAYNRKRLFLKAGDSTASWNYTTGSFRASNNSSANSLTVFSGLAEEVYECTFEQNVTAPTDTVTIGRIGIGVNSTSSASGKTGVYGIAIDGGDVDNYGASCSAKTTIAPSLGISVITALELGSSGVSFQGSEDDMLLLAQWMG